jgi:hypothetical protein
MHCAVETLLPELAKPWVAAVRVGIEAEVIVIEIRDAGRVDADGYAATRLALKAVSDVTTVRPPIAATQRGIGIILLHKVAGAMSL